MTRYRVPERVGVVRQDDDVFVARLPAGPIMRLSGTAAVIWIEALSDADGTIAGRVALAVTSSESEIAEGVSEFIQTLITGGLLVERVGEAY